MGGIGEFEVPGYRNPLKQKKSPFHGAGGEMGIELESIGSKDFFPHELEYQRKKVGLG